MTDTGQISTTDLTIPASDGFELAATLFEPAQDNGRLVLINSAMAVKRGYYRKYAAFLAEHGFTTITYDYRGIGGSRPASLRGFKAYLWQWGAQDLDGLIAWIEVRYPSYKLLVVSHSVGGQIIGLTARNTRVAGMFGVAVQSAYWRLWSGFWRWRTFFIWYALIPVLARLLGYIPGKLGIGEDLPAGVALDWAHGGRCPKYILDLYCGTQHDHFVAFAAPFVDYSFSDDHYAPYETVKSLLTFYPNAVKTHKHLQPSDIGTQSIGHFGFFRDKFANTLWAESAAWLEGV
ncbi:MAG: alpha/beta fold hydrolase [Chloroflexota bacterium]